MLIRTSSEASSYGLGPDQLLQLSKVKMFKNINFSLVQKDFGLLGSNFLFAPSDLSIERISASLNWGLSHFYQNQLNMFSLDNRKKIFNL